MLDFDIKSHFIGLYYLERKYNMDNKRLDIELIRIIAVFFVIFNHTGTLGYFLFASYEPRSIQYWIYLFISVFCKISVPLFFMITGALMLNRKEESLRYLWKHRVLHICCILIIWSFFYYMVLVKEGGEAFNIVRFFRQLYVYNWNFSFWYLYVYIALLICLPLLQKIAQSLSNKDYIYMTILYITFKMIIPSLQYILWRGRYTLNNNIDLGWITSNIVIFPLMGYFLSYRVKEFWNKKRILILWGINICTILMSCYLTYYRASVMGVCNEESSQAFHDTFVLINCITVFVTCQYLNDKSQLLSKISKQIISLGGCTFGIYLTHIYIKDHTAITRYISKLFQDIIPIPRMLYAFIYCIIIFICGYIITLLLKKIPFIKRIVS